jgi:hypothetical protein
VADSVKCIEGGKTEKVLNFALFTPAQKKVISSNLVKVGVARATLCHTLATPLLGDAWLYYINHFFT